MKRLLLASLTGAALCVPVAESSAYVLLEGGSLVAWGSNDEGQLGNGASGSNKPLGTYPKAWATPVRGDGDPPERIGRVRAGWLNVIASDQGNQTLSSRELLDRFKMEKVFWRQFEIGQVLAAANDRGAIAELEAWLTHDDRHQRGNVAFVLGRLGDPRGFETIAAILADRSSRSVGQGIPNGKWTVEAQIRADRYYAAHLLGDLKDPRGVDVLIPLLNDKDVHYVVPWSLAEIGDRRAIKPLVAQTDRDDPSLRVLAIGALERLDAREALPRLRELLQDARRSNFGERTTVAQAAERAIAVLSR
jgi:HEAT repeat protein